MPVRDAIIAYVPGASMHHALRRGKVGRIDGADRGSRDTKRITLATPVPPIGQGGVGARTVPPPQFSPKKGLSRG